MARIPNAILIAIRNSFLVIAALILALDFYDGIRILSALWLCRSGICCQHRSGGRREEPTIKRMNDIQAPVRNGD
jgi:hypothetical protein